MDNRRQEGGRDDRSERSQQWDDESQHGVSTQSRSGSEASRSEGSSGGGDWQGYVVPYRYYGPGYQGVGYYSVMYQGPGGDEDMNQGQQGQWQGQGQQRQGQQGQWQQRPSPQGRSYGRQGQGQGQYGYGRQGAYAGYGGYEQGSSGRSGQGPEDWQTSTGQGSQGGFAGRGPKNYQRSDDRLREEVCDRLMEHDQLDAGEIDVQVRNGEVTLTGTVPDKSMKRFAEDAAEQVMGVRDVMNQLRVAGQTGQTDQSGQTGQTGQKPSDRSMSGSTQDMASTHPATPNGKRQPAGTNR